MPSVQKRRPGVKNSPQEPVDGQDANIGPVPMLSTTAFD